MTHIISMTVDGVVSSGAGLQDTVRLTNKEAGVLLALGARKGGLLTKPAIMTELYCGREEPEPKIVDVLICKVRRKLASIGITGAIETVWGYGYKMSPDYRLELPDGHFVYMEIDHELNHRLEDLALATRKTVPGVLKALVLRGIDDLERETWT